MSLLDAALAYAECGWFVLPAHPNTKRPIGNEWQHKASRDPDQIRRWWAEDPRRGIALHVGRSGAVAFDLDKDSLADMPPEMAKALRSGMVQRSRTGVTDRGHYVFAVGEDESFGNSAGAFAPYGDVRGRGVILAQPTPHMKADQGGRYFWPAAGPVPGLPPALRDCLRAAPEREASPLTSRELETFFETHTANDRPDVLGWVVDKFVAEADVSSGIHEAMRDVLPWAFREAVAGSYPAREAYARLEAAWEAAFLRRSANANGSAAVRLRPAPAEFQELAEWAAAQAGLADRKETRARLSGAGSELPEFVRAALGPGGLWHPDTPHPGHNREHLRALELIDERKADAVFQVLGPTDWAQPVKDPEFLIAGVLCRDTFGVNAGPKKSLKTHDNQAIALAVATGLNLYRSERFPVGRQGRVLYLVGEGGVVPVRRTLHRMARAYGIPLSDIAQDPAFPLTVAFGAAPIDGEPFRDALRRLLDKHQPELVLLESFYNFHPATVEAGNLYQRGQVLDDYHKFVRSECAGATSFITDHFRSTAGKSLDLDNVSMAGQAENADSWHLRYHRAAPDVSNGKFSLRVGFNSRQWGGTEWDVDWELGAFDHERGCHVGDIAWNVAPVGGAAADTREVSGNGMWAEDLISAAILDYVDAHPDTSKSAAYAVVAKKLTVAEKKVRDAWANLEADRLLIQVESTVERRHKSGTRTVRATAWRRGNARVRLSELTGEPAPHDVDVAP